ncbi:MAG: right-handed parallel beta-helix repeat-containing protein, partial [Clostridia bacterium]
SSGALAELNTKPPKNDPTFQTGIKIEDSNAPYHNTKISPYGAIRRTDLSGNELAIYPDMNTKKWMLEVAEAASPERRGAIYSEINKPSKADVGLSSVDNTSDAAKPVSSATQAALNTKANTASPSLTGTPTAPTAPVGTNTTQLATTAFVQANKSGGGYGKKYATFVIGTTASGHTATDVDYLCDGTADDVEIQAAINAIKYPIQHGKIIILPGTYNITQQINCYVDIVIEGVNRNTVILKRAFAGNSNDPFLLFSAIDTGLFEIKNIRFDGVKATYTSNNSGIGSMNAGGGDTVRIDNVWFRNFATNAIEINTYQSANVTNCYISEGLNGIKIQGSHISVSGNQISGSGIGVLCNSERSNIWGNTIGGSASGSSITVSGSGNLISGNLLTGKDIVNTGTNNTIVNNKFI